MKKNAVKRNTTNTNQKPAVIKKSLQKLPDYNEPISDEHEKLLRLLLSDKKTLTKEDYDAMTIEKKEFLQEALSYAINILGYNDRDKLIEKFKVFTFDIENNRNQLWAFNHTVILNKLNELIKSYGRMPTRLELSTATGLSRQTINKHMNEYFGSNEYIQKQEEYLVLRERIIAKVYKYAVEGDVRACKLFLDATNGIANTSHTIRNQQNNFIQINGLNITEEQIKLLPERQLKQLEKILKPLGVNSVS